MYYCEICGAIYESDLGEMKHCPSSAFHPTQRPQLTKLGCESLDLVLKCKSVDIIVGTIKEGRRGIISREGNQKDVIKAEPRIPCVTLKFFSRDRAVDFYEKNQTNLSMFHVWNLPVLEKSYRVDQELSLVTPHILKYSSSTVGMYKHLNTKNVVIGPDEFPMYDMCVVAGGDKFFELATGLNIPEKDRLKLSKLFYDNYWKYCDAFYKIFDDYVK